MAYQCRQCNRVGSEAGACPVCNIPMDIRLQNDTQPDMTPVVPAEEVTPEVTPAVAPVEAPMPEIAPGAPTVEAPVEKIPAEGGDPTMA